jgi:hypothetical protein
MDYALSTIRHASRPTPVIEVAGRHHRLDVVAPGLFRQAPSRGLMNLFDDWAQSEQQLAELATREAEGLRTLAKAPAVRRVARKVTTVAATVQPVAAAQTEAVA